MVGQDRMYIAFKVFVFLYLAMEVSFFNRDCIHAWILVVMTRLNLGLKSGTFNSAFHQNL